MKFFLTLPVLVLTFFIPIYTKAQLDNRFLESPISLSDSIEENLLLNIQTNSFFKNNEYFNDISTGYTLMGSQLFAQMAYLPNQHFRIQTGIFLYKDFGNDTMLKIRPLLTMKFQKNGYSFLFGNLEGSYSHRMLEPLYDYERFINQPLESGIQFKIEKDKVWSDTWLNWEKMEYLGSNYQERFSLGHHSNFTIYKNKNAQWNIPFQFIFSHRGGQIDNDTTALQTIGNTSIGFMYSFQLEHPFLNEIKTENYYNYFFDLSPTKQLPYSTGHGFYLNASVRLIKHARLALSYWNGEHFISSRGGALFQSISSVYGKQGYIEPNRQLLFLKIQYAKRVLNAFNVDVRFEPFYDFNASTIEYSYSLYLTYKNDFRIFNFYKNK